MRRFVPPLAVALVLLAFAAGASGAARLYAPSYGSGPPEVIGAFERADNGSLTPVAGSPFAAYPGPPYAVGGLIGFGFGPDGSKAVAGFLFDGGVQGMTVGAGGQITPTNSVVTRQSEGIAVSPDGRFAYEATREYPPGTESQGINVFAIGADGALSPFAESFDVGTSFSQVAIAPNGRFLFATTGSGVKRFAIEPDGGLSYLGTTSLGTFGIWPTTSPDGRFLFVGDAGGKGGVYSFTIGADGSLSPNGESALTGGSAVKAFSVSPDGKFLYMPDEGQQKIVVASVAADGSLSVIGSIPVEDPEVSAVSPDGRYLYWQHGGETEGIAVAALGADGMPVVLPFNAPWEVDEPVRFAFQPGPAPVAAFKAKAAAPGAAATFNAGSSTNAAHYSWNFGDGTTLAEGGPKPSHAYKKAGRYTVTLAVTDGQGCGAQQIYTGQSTTCPGGTATTTTAVVDTLPVVSKLKAQPKKFLPKGVGAKGKAGTTFRYALNEKAKVNLKIERKLPGRLVGRKCKKPTSANKGRKKCSRFVKAGSRKGTGKVGINKVSFNGKLKGRPLLPGAYRLTAVATDSAQGRSAPRTAAFRVLPY